MMFCLARQRFALLLGVAFCIAASAADAAEKQPAVRPPWTASRIQGSPEAPEPYRIVPAFPNLRFQKPTCIEEFPDASRLLVTEIGGKIFSFPKSAEASQPDLVVDLWEWLPNDVADRGVSLFDAEFHPRFRENRHLFICYVHPGEGGHTRVSRITLTGDSPPRAEPGSEVVVITWPSGGHNGGCLEFGIDGYLYISTGDGTGPNPPDGLTTGQDVSDLLGAILRLDVEQSTNEQPYFVPPDNPFRDLKGARPEIWAYGLRNPWKFGVDPQTGAMFVADNGWESWEMVHQILRGGNCGWPVMEGRAALRTEVAVGPTPILPPVKDHPHTEANSVIGGPVYRGGKLPGLVGAFIYGDYITGTIWAIHPDKDDFYSHTTLVDTDQQITAFTQGSGGELYVLDYDFTGQIYELLPTDRKDTSADFPRRLSETGLFASLETMQPAPGVVPYEVIVPRWMDGAQAQRWVAIPEAGKVQLSPSHDQPAVYPEGTVLVKHLTLPQDEGRQPLRLETQILHYEGGVWRPYSYLWDDAGQDAHLVSPLGASRLLRVADPTQQGGLVERTWRVSAVNECKLCHNAGARFVLGFTPNQLDRALTDASAVSDQRAALAAQAVLTAAPRLSDEDPSRLVDPHDRSQNLDDRARSYLHANCSMCHHPGGNAIVSFYLRRDLPFEQLNTNKGTGIGTFGMRDAKVIAPGDPYRSLLMYRMAKLGYARMPYIGSHAVDGAAVALIEEWIRSLKNESNSAVSAPAQSDSAESKALQSLVDRKLASRERRDGAIGTLLQSTEGSLALVAQMHRGALSAEDVQTAARLGAASPRSDLRGLFETFLPESQRRATLGSNIDPQAILSRQGSHERGRLIFFSDGARCRACHEIDDREKSLGPTLQEIGKKYPHPAELLQHVLQPSLKIEDPVAAYSIVTKEGRVVTGLLVETTEREVVVKTAEKQIVRLARQDIEAMEKSEKSLMPDNILSDLTAQEAADLFEYIRSQAGGE